MKVIADDRNRAAEGTLLPGYLFRPDNSGELRPTLIYHGGYDSVLEEAYFAAAAGAVRDDAR